MFRMVCKLGASGEDATLEIISPPMDKERVRSQVGLVRKAGRVCRAICGPTDVFTHNLRSCSVVTGVGSGVFGGKIRGGDMEAL